jgi:VIT1/CCC1 family predicted Fe2+/Mn2+ transporter
MFSSQFQKPSLESISSQKSIEHPPRPRSTQSLTSSLSSIELPTHKHYSHKSTWLRAGILGASDGLVSTGALLLGVLAGGSTSSLILTGTSALVAGALSMALGEWVSVASQRDSERADIDLEMKQHSKGGVHEQLEFEELRRNYIKKGLSPELANQVALELSAKPLEELVKIHVYEECGIDTEQLTNPFQACFASALAFVAGGFPPLLAVILTGSDRGLGIIAVVMTCWILFLVFGAIGANIGGYSRLKGAVRLAFGGSVALSFTFGIGLLFNVQASG